MDKKEIVGGLKSIGLKKGDIVLLHSSLASLGHVEGGARAVVDAFIETIGKGGTLVVPAFGNLGIIADTVKKHPDAIISDCPSAAVAAIGRDAKKICAGHWDAETAHGEGTPYLKIAEMGGYVCLLGVDQDRNTTLHSVEAVLQLPYLKTITRTKQTSTGEVTGSWKYFPGPHRDFIELDKYLRKSGKMRTGTIGNAVVRLIKSQDLLDAALEQGRANPGFVLCNNPNCADCRSQKAALRRARFSGESFSLAISSAFAGNYVPEMIETAKSLGINNIELDIIQGFPVNVIPDETLKKAVCEFRENDINVIAMKISFVPGDFDRIIEKAQAAGIDRISMPLSHESSAYLTKALEKNMRITFYNRGIDSDKASSILAKMKAEGLKPDFLFSPAEFAACGEKPFLVSYKKKAQKFISGVYIEDSLFNSLPGRLAEGNSEIKEIISIVRCSSFNGFMIFSALNKYASTPESAVQRFEQLLDNM